MDFVYFITGKLSDATGSYDIPFYISGAVLWSAGTVLAVVVKCSCWKESRGFHHTAAEFSVTQQDDYERCTAITLTTPEAEGLETNV